MIGVLSPACCGHPQGQVHRQLIVGLDSGSSPSRRSSSTWSPRPSSASSWTGSPVTVKSNPGWYDACCPVSCSAPVSGVSARLTHQPAENLRQTTSGPRWPGADLVQGDRRVHAAKLPIPGRHPSSRRLRWLLGGAIITERIFNIRGVGGYIYRGIHSRGWHRRGRCGDHASSPFVYPSLNLLVDLLYGVRPQDQP